jgi:hypothetical protein
VELRIDRLRHAGMGTAMGGREVDDELLTPKKVGLLRDLFWFLKMERTVLSQVVGSLTLYEEERGGLPTDGC